MKSRSKHFLFLLLVLTGLSYFTWIIYNAGETLQNTSEWVSHTHQVINNISAISTTISEIESDFRAWQIADRDIFAAEIRKRTAVLQEQLATIKYLTADNTTQLEKIAGVRILSDKLINWQQDFMQSQSQSTTELKSKLPGLTGKLLMDSIKQKLAIMLAEEELLMQQRISHNKIVADNKQYITIASGIFYMIFAILVMFRMDRNATRRKLGELSLLNSEI